jgi:hypothetical protein
VGAGGDADGADADVVTGDGEEAGATAAVADFDGAAFSSAGAGFVGACVFESTVVAAGADGAGAAAGFAVTLSLRLPGALNVRPPGVAAEGDANTRGGAAAAAAAGGEAAAAGSLGCCFGD